MCTVTGIGRRGAHTLAVVHLAWETQFRNVSRLTHSWSATRLIPGAGWPYRACAPHLSAAHRDMYVVQP